ncbi:MAG TPA: acyl-CoA desaturase [Myxococcaceae bacterium]|nr:acyl-CoA desaturase [Myxococcaceae bacterium]
MNQDYVQLSRTMKERGLLDDRAPAGYLVRLAFNAAVVIACLATIPRVAHSLPLVLLNSTVLAFFIVQCVIIAHDSMHRAVFRSPAANDTLALLIWNLMVGISHTWFFAYHTKHHVQSNRIGHDPNLEVPFFLPDRDQVMQTRGLRRWFAKYQGYFFLPFLFLSGGDFLGRTMRHMGKMKKLSAGFFVEATLMLAHYAMFIGFPIYVLGPGRAALYILLHYALAGFYGGVVFATNHMGMPLVGSDEKIDYVAHQVSTSRNLTPHAVNNYVFAGLHYQIEHHLFPTISYHRIKDARVIIEEHCKQRGLRYHQVGTLKTFAEMISYLHQVGEPLRRPPPSTPGA